MNGQAPLILVADDEQDIRTILRTKLEASGFRVIEAENGQDAIDKCRLERPVLVVMDVRMPVMSGTEAVSHIKEDRSLSDIKVVFLSNFGEEQEINAWVDKKYAQEIGAVDYIKKSDDLAAIIQKITAIIHA
jgi:CheY-like chemotaxis protein